MTSRQLISPESFDDALRTIEKLNRQYEETASELAELRKEKEQFELEHERVGVFLSAIDQCSESVFFTDLQGKILYVNKSFERTSGYSCKELIGRTPRILKSGLHPPEFYREMWQTVLDGNVWRSRVTNRRKDGSHYHEEASVAPVRDDHGDIICFVSVKTDISELLRNQQELEEANAKLTKSNAELEQFAYVASHDLQEPLRAVASCMQIVKRRNEGLLDEQSNEFVDHAVGACLRMQELIEGLLTISRVTAASDQLNPADAARALGQARANLAFTIEPSGASLTHDSLPVVLGNEQMLTYLFQNLIGNALKFSGNKTPEIHIGVRPKGDLWLFSVKDNGIGIGKEHRSRIFQIFQRLHTRDEYPGTGIGLSICQKIVTQHGGRIWVDSEPGQGSTFFFTLPALPDSDFLPTEPTTPPNP